MVTNLTHEARSFSTSGYSNSEEQRRHIDRVNRKAADAVELKKYWHEYEPNTLYDRYHNAALSLAFYLTSGVYVQNGYLDDKRSLALSEFLYLLEWMVPLSWDVQTVLVRELRRDLGTVVVKSPYGLVDLVLQAHILHEIEWVEAYPERLWGHVDVSSANKRINVSGLGGRVPAIAPVVRQVYREANIQHDRSWTDSSACAEGGRLRLQTMRPLSLSCDHHQRVHAQSSSLWIRSGYLTSPRHVDGSVRDFIAYFFPCNVCCWNFLDMYDRCGHGHCRRISDEIQRGLGASGEATQGNQVGRDLALWTWEVHNSINVLIMREVAEEEIWVVSEEDLFAGRWPKQKMCADCWTDEKTMEQYDREVVFYFFKAWYWPSFEEPRREAQFDSALIWRGQRRQINSKKRKWMFGVTSRLLRFYCC